jgi:DNA invertase Pin-like site-specific DNA recombinase
MSISGSYLSAKRKGRPTDDQETATILRMRNEGYSYREIGVALGLSPGAVEQRIRRLRAKGPTERPIERPTEGPTRGLKEAPKRPTRGLKEAY